MSEQQHTSRSTDPEPGAARRRQILITVSLALMMVVSAVSGLNVALPDLARDTGATATELQWIVDAYTMVFAGLLLIAGAIGDRYGRRRLLIAGLVTFGTAAAFGLVLDDPTALIVLRAVMGMGAACVMPTTLSIITTSFPPEERARAVGVWVGVAGGGAVIGLLGSGLLLEFFPWNSFFGLNVALAVLALVGALRVIPSSVDEHPPALDPVGGGLSLLFVTSLVFAIIEGPGRGWSDPLVLGAFALAVLSLAGFVTHELRREDPLLDPRLFRLRGFSTGSLSIAVQFFSSFGFLFIVLQYLQYVAGRSPLEAALSMLPLPVVLIPIARRAPAIAARVGTNRTTALGLTLIAAGLAVVSIVTVDLQYPVFAAGIVLFAAGMGLAGTPATTAIVSALPDEKQGVASAVNDVSREFGSALGIALLGSILNDAYRSNLAGAVRGLPASVAEGAQGSVAFTQSPAITRLGERGSELAEAARQAFVDAAGTALLTASGLLLLTAVVIAVLGPRAERRAAVADVPQAA